MSPLAKKAQAKAFQRTSTAPKEIRESRKFIPDQPLPSDNEDAELTETEQGDEYESIVTAESEFDDDEEEDEEDGEYGEEGEEEEEWAPSPAPSSHRSHKTPKAKTKANQHEPTPSPDHHPNHKGSTILTNVPGNKTRLSKLHQEMEDLSIGGPDDSVVVIPTKKYRARLQSSNDDNEDDNDDDIEIEVPAKKKKR